MIAICAISVKRSFDNCRLLLCSNGEPVGAEEVR